MILINDELEYSVFLPRSESNFLWLDSHFTYHTDNDDFYDHDTVFVTFENAADALMAAECLSLRYASKLVH